MIGHGARGRAAPRPSTRRSRRPADGAPARTVGTAAVLLYAAADCRLQGSGGGHPPAAEWVGMASRSEDEVLLSAARLVVGVSVRAADQIGEASLVQLRALTVLAELGVANLVQLAEGMGVTVSTTSRLVDRLVAAGFVDRRPSELTRREISISLTAGGRAVLARYDGLRVQALHARLDQLSRQRRSAAVDALRDLAATTPQPEPERTAAP
jgi:DNA-binding MarR family transcriptional regulator